MKHSTIKILIALLLLAFVLPQDVFSSAPVAATAPQPSAAAPALLPISVVQKVAQPSLTVGSGFSANCSLPLPQATALQLQQQPKLNLNQPASCFSLRVTEILPSRTLSVQELHRGQQTVVVAVSKTAIAPYRYLPSSLPIQSLPVLAVAFVLAVAVSGERRRLLEKTAQTVRSARQFVKSISLHELSMLLC